MGVELTRLDAKDGSLEKWKNEWSQQCEQHGDNFDDYFGHLFPLIKADCEAEKVNVDWLTLSVKGESRLICMLNPALIKGHDEPVLRVRHIYVSPNLDYDGSDFFNYAQAMTTLITLVLKASELYENVGTHIKIHVRSPEDLTFLKVACDINSEHTPLKSVESKGNWLYIERNTGERS